MTYGQTSYAPSYPLTSRCDASASGSEAATHEVATRAGTLYLCTHHTYVHGPALTAAGYAVTALSTPQEPAQAVSQHEAGPAQVVPEAQAEAVPEAPQEPAQASGPVCRHCAVSIAELGAGFWVHGDTGKASCAPEGSTLRRTIAEPA